MSVKYLFNHLILLRFYHSCLPNALLPSLPPPPSTSIFFTGNHFLTKCIFYHKSLQSNQIYKHWQIKLLDHETSEKYRNLWAASTHSNETKSTILEKLSLLINSLINWTLNIFLFKKKVCVIKKTLENILQALGIHNDFQLCDPKKAVNNYNGAILPEFRNFLNFLLAFGLDFNLPIKILRFDEYYTPQKNYSASYTENNAQQTFKASSED